jgi:hypothetical protein
MKYYKDKENNIYAFYKEGFEEITSPILEDGTVLPNHDGISDLETKEDGTPYKYYNEDGTPYFEKIMVEDKANLLNQMETAIQTHIDNQAQTLGYDDINSIAKYLRPSSPFYDECVKLGDWCDACWAKAYEVQMEVEAGTRELPENIVSELPSYEN